MYQRTWTLGLEAQEEDTLEAVEPVITEEPSESVEATDLEVNEASDDLETTDRQAEDLADDISDLQTVHDVVADSLSDGGCEVSNARLIDVATESFCSRWDIPRAAVACEAMAYATPSVRANVACEGIMDTIKAGIKRLIEFIKSVIGKLKSFFSAAQELPAKLIERATKLEAVATERTDKEFNRKKWVVGAWSKNISMGGELKPKEIFNRPGKIINTTEFIFEDLVELANGMVAKINATANESIAKRLKLRFFGSESMPAQMKQKLGRLTNDAKIVSFPGELYLVGERMVIQGVDDPVAKSANEYKMSYIIGEIDHDQASIDPPSHDDISKAIHAAKEFAEALKKHTDAKGDYEKRLEIMEQGISVLEQSASGADSTEKIDWNILIEDRRREMSNFRVLSQMMLISLRNAANGMLAYAEAGLRCYA